MKKTIYPLADSTKRKACVREVYNEDDIHIVEGDSRRALAKIENNTFQCCITSPPYWGLRDYGRECVGIELNPEYVKIALGRIDKVGPTLPLYAVANSH